MGRYSPVMLSLPPMLILDEATSSIDTRTEMRIQNAFDKMMEGRTSFVVAHRLSTIREADCILVMKSGSIVEQGFLQNYTKISAQRVAGDRSNWFSADAYFAPPTSTPNRLTKSRES